MKLINRSQYTDKIRPFIEKGLIIVLTGQRRVGKSCILQQLIQEITKDEQANIIYINKEKTEFDFIRTHHELTQYVNKQWNKGKENYLLIDEIQEIMPKCYRANYRLSYQEDTWSSISKASATKSFWNFINSLTTMLL